METRANFALIGAFTLAVVMAAFGFVYWFSGPSKTAARQSYQLVFNGSVSGLSRGAAVLFNGLRVGEVSKLALKADDPGQVVAQIDVEKTIPIKTDTKASLEFTGLTGIASVALSGGSADAAKLEAEPGAAMPVIIAEKSGFQNLLQTAERVARQTDEFVEKANKILDTAATPLANTAKNAETFSKALADNADGIGTFMSSMSDVGKTIKPLTAKLESLATNTDKIVAAVEPAKVKSIVDDVAKASSKLSGVLDSVNGFIGNASGSESKGMFAEVGEAAKSIKKLADNLDVRTRDIAANINKFAGTGLRQYEALAVDGRKTLDTINRAVQSLERDPSQIIFGGKSKVPEYSGNR